MPHGVAANTTHTRGASASSTNRLQFGLEHGKLTLEKPPSKRAESFFVGGVTNGALTERVGYTYNGVSHTWIYRGFKPAFIR